MTGYQTGTGNELKNDGTWTYTYDSEGNMTEKSQGANATTWFYTFDSNNQMTTAQQYSKASGGTLQASVTYVYDALQNRLEVDSWTQSGGTTTVTRFGYDGNQVWVDLNSSNQLQVRYLHGDVIDQLFARINPSGTAAWYLTDRLESIRGMVDNTGALQETVAYDGYGNITSDSNSSFGDRYKFTGRELDTVTGLQYNRARYYGAAIGRWVSQDPLGFKAGDVNLYRFVNNNPNSKTDPLGQAGDPFWWYLLLQDPTVPVFFPPYTAPTQAPPEQKLPVSPYPTLFEPPDSPPLNLGGDGANYPLGPPVLLFPSPGEGGNDGKGFMGRLGNAISKNWGMWWKSDDFPEKPDAPGSPDLPIIQVPGGGVGLYFPNGAPGAKGSNMGLLGGYFNY